MKKNTVLWLLAAAAVGVGGYLYLNQAQAQAQADTQPSTDGPDLSGYNGGEHYLPIPDPYPEPVIDVIIQPPTVDDPSYATDWGI